MNNYEGTIKREKMLANFSTMIKPARIITNLSQEELAAKSGLSVELINGVENGLHRFHESHYLALAAVFDNVKYTDDKSIYKAILRILTPEGETFDNDYDNDFILVRRWLDTFTYSGEYNSSESECEAEAEYESECEPEDKVLSDDFLEDLAANYNLYADTSAIEDENFPALVSRLEPLLIQNDSKIFVPSAAVDELEKDIELSVDSGERLDLSEALDYIKLKNEAGLIHICEISENSDYEEYEESDDPEEILAGILNNLPEYERTAVITQDSGFAKKLGLVYQNVIAAHISDTGDLIFWR